MALIVEGHSRIFKFEHNGKEIKLPDPNPNMTLEEVQKFYAGQYPEITTASLNGPKIVGNKAEYTVKTKVGTKG